MHWLENVAPQSHGIFNVSCVIWTEKINNLHGVSNSSGTVDLTATVSHSFLPGIVLINVNEKKFAYETTTTRYNCDGEPKKLFGDTLRVNIYSLKFIPDNVMPDNTNCSAGPAKIKNAALVEEAVLKFERQEEKSRK